MSNPSPSAFCTDDAFIELGLCVACGYWSWVTEEEADNGTNMGHCSSRKFVILHRVRDTLPNDAARLIPGDYSDPDIRTGEAFGCIHWTPKTVTPSSSAPGASAPTPSR